MKGQIFDGDFYPVFVHWFRLPGIRILLAAPNVVEYGHIGLEFFYALVKAHEHHARLFFIRPGKVVTEAFFELTCNEVHIVRATPLRQFFFNAYWGLAEGVEFCRIWWREFKDTVFREKRKALGGAIGKHRDTPTGQQLRRIRREIDLRAPRINAKNIRPYFRRTSLQRPFKLRFRDDLLDAVRQSAERAGIKPDARLVMLHVREPGWKRGREAQLLKPHMGRDDSVRNAHVESHLPAVDYLVADGYTVVRMGDPSMPPLAHPGVIDLATLNPPDARLQLYCLLNSRFMVCGESGPLGVSWVTGTPTLSVNCTDPISAFPLRGDSLYMLKTVYDRATGQRMSMIELLSERYLQHLRDTTRFRYVENTADEILAAVKEMCTLLDAEPPESESQRRYKHLATQTAVDLREQLNYVRKWGADEGFLGSGRLVQFVAARDFPAGSGQSSPAAASTTGLVAASDGRLARLNT